MLRSQQTLPSRVCMSTSFSHNHKPAYFSHVPQSYKLSPPCRRHQHCNICTRMTCHSLLLLCLLRSQQTLPSLVSCRYHCCGARAGTHDCTVHAHTHTLTHTHTYTYTHAAQSADLSQAQRHAATVATALEQERTTAQCARKHTHTHTHTHTHMLRSQQTSPKPSAMPLPLLRRWSRNARLLSARTHTHTHTHAAQSADLSQAQRHVATIAAALEQERMTAQCAHTAAEGLRAQLRQTQQQLSTQVCAFHRSGRTAS